MLLKSSLKRRTCRTCKRLYLSQQHTRETSQITLLCRKSPLMFQVATKIRVCIQLSRSYLLRASKEDSPQPNSQLSQTCSRRIRRICPLWQIMFSRRVRLHSSKTTWVSPNRLQAARWLRGLHPLNRSHKGTAKAAAITA